MIIDLLKALARIVLFGAGIIAIGVILFSGVWLFATPDEGAQLGISIPEVDFSSPEALERSLWGVYLGFHKEEIEQPYRDDDTPVDFRINSGESVVTIAARLEENGIIGNAGLFRRLAGYRDVDTQLEVGEYVLRPNMTMEEVLETLQHAKSETIVITIPEGWRVEQVAALFAQEGFGTADEVMRLVKDGSWALEEEKSRDFLMDRPVASLEGYLMPETYHVPRDYTAAQFIGLMLDTFGERFTPEMRQAAAADGHTIFQVVTMASIVEREAQLADERALIAGVYWNRITEGMYLQATPTVQYALGYQVEAQQWWKTPISMEELTKTISTYNTYLNPGLPPGPICNPGIAALEATVYSAETEYLFFHAKWDGSHVFSKTYDEHLQNQELYSSE